MNRSGDVWHDSAMESFFYSPNIERVNCHVYSTCEESTADVFDCVERFYNLGRRQSALGCLSPVECENAFGSA